MAANALPDPLVIANAFNTLSIQSQRVANVGALQNQHNLLAAIQGLGHQIQAIQQQMQAMQQQMNQRFATLNQRFDILENRQINFETAAVNARLLQNDSAAVLQRLVDIRDGNDIPNFPATVLELHTMNDAGVDAILPALGMHLDPNTPLAIKRESILRKWILK